MFWEYFKVLAPSAGLAFVFWLIMRSLLRADAGERSAVMEAQEREAKEWKRLKLEKEAEEARKAQQIDAAEIENAETGDAE